MSKCLSADIVPMILTQGLEVVLAVMIRAFKFSLSDKEIYWNMATVIYPTVGKESPKPELYLKVERIDE